MSPGGGGVEAKEMGGVIGKEEHKGRLYTYKGPSLVVAEFKYLWRVLTALYENFLSVVGN